MQSDIYNFEKKTRDKFDISSLLVRIIVTSILYPQFIFTINKYFSIEITTFVSTFNLNSQDT